MRFDAVREGLVGAARSDDTPRNQVETTSVLEPLAVGLTHEAVIVLHDVVHVVGVPIRSPHQGHVSLVEAQPFPDHVHVDIGQSALHDVLVGLHPRPRAREFRAPQEPYRALGTRNPSLLDQCVQRSRHLEDAGAPRLVVVCALLHNTLEEVR